MKLSQLIGETRTVALENGEAVGRPIYRSADGEIRIDEVNLSVVVAFNGDAQVTRCGDRARFQQEVRAARALAQYFAG
ncbi:hypothetical protein HAQ00_11690 [Acidithiobacillus caldus ATCC 51756]|jgi:C4-type Zn-finger protein|uniref:hypothetical protein n=1 Tax=Acidithiobacillus caldus TaxID=33059 RepID=UPI001C065D21|nr:hypothetical protein [Acidithiobacillus caldus]MBU2736364.1 hypothetical protein [Acidithiobacillus caldus ATCC 51756]MBU2801022.1 hypothetical protein [Acidithiobacillus caldus]